jgi:hypothetical protein
MATFGNIIAGGSTVNSPPSGDKAVSPFVLDRQGTLDHLLFNFTSSGATSCSAVIYDNTGTGGDPGALVATSTLIPSTGSGLVAFPFSSPPTLNAGTYWAGLTAVGGGITGCQAATNGIAFNSDIGGPTNPFGTASHVSFQYPEVVFYTPVLPVGTAYGQLVGGDALTHFNPTNTIVLLQITIPVAGKISKLTTFYQNNYTANAVGMIYDNSGSGGAPGALLGATNQLTNPVINGNDFTFSSPIHVAAGTYWIGVNTDTNLAVFHLNDSTPNYTSASNVTYSTSPPSTFPLAGSTAGSGSWCLWATFAADATNQDNIMLMGM